MAQMFFVIDKFEKIFVLKQEQFVQLYCVYLFSHKHLSQNNLFIEQ